MKIILADDHQLILDGLHTALQTHLPQASILKAINRTELVGILESTPVDVLIQDVKFGNDHVSDFLDDIISNYPQLKIILLTSVSDSVSIAKLGKKVQGYILKSESLQEIFTTIKEVMAGNTYFSEQAQQKLNEILPSDEITLTRREREVLEVIMQEKSTKEIADILSISEKTVELHRSNLFVKLDVKNITGLIKKTIALNLLDN
jgi:DNA-binding NarL/FixJ family response regulator